MRNEELKVNDKWLIKNWIGMKEWFEVGIRYKKTMEDGMRKKVTEKYLVDALSFSEAEVRIVEQMVPLISGEMRVVTEAIANVAEVFANNKVEADTWYKLKVAFITLNEKTGKEKKEYKNMLVQSTSTNDAEKDLQVFMKDTLADYRIEKVEETKLMDVLFYNEEEEILKSLNEE